MSVIQWFSQDGVGRALLQRRGIALGYVQMTTSLPSSIMAVDDIVAQWKQDQAVFLPGLIRRQLDACEGDIARTEQWVLDILQGDYPSDVLPEALQPARFMLSSCSEERHDRQAIEKLYFDDEQGDAALQPWCKASWLSFHDDDASLRFRFSFGEEGFEDVAANPIMQENAAKLCSFLFPESRVVENESTLTQVFHQLFADDPTYVERIVYFNAPNGGAQMHHDVERGHAGVVYAQLSGQTFWLAASKPQLITEVRHFCQQFPDIAVELFTDAEDRQAFLELLRDDQAIDLYLDADDHELLEVLMDRHPQFIAHMVAIGCAYILQAGDVLLLPQADLQRCVWHSVFCLGDVMGQALSFAVRPQAIT